MIVAAERLQSMATATLATAAGAAAIYYYSKWGTPWSSSDEFPDDMASSSSSSARTSHRRKSNMPRLIRAPSNWFEAIGTLMETLRFTYSETLGKWPIGDLAFGINFLLKRQGHLHVASVYAGDGLELRGVQVVTELKHLLRLLNICLHFSKKPFPVFLELTGFNQTQVLLQESKAALLKPAFVVLLDDSAKSILLVIRGTHSIKDTLTAVTGAVVPFHHTLLDDGGVQSLVLGYAHCGMVAAARWIAQLSTPHLLQALEKYPTYKIQVVGHSLGGGTAALLTYILRERKEFSSACCVSFAPAACMTWELAESGKPFVTSVVNGSDLVPTFSAASLDGLRAEVTASAWVSDFKEQIERTRILRTVFRSATAVSSRLSSIARVRSGVANAGAIWRPVSSGTQVVMRQALAAVRTRPSLSGWGCIGPRRRAVVAGPVETDPRATDAPVAEAGPPGELQTSDFTIECEQTDEWLVNSQNNQEDEIEATFADEELAASRQGVDMEPHPGDFLWHELEVELNRHKEENSVGREEEAKAAREITKEEEVVMATASELGRDIVKPSTEEGTAPELNRFYPPGRVIHMVSPLPENASDSEEEVEEEGIRFKPTVGLFEPDRALYGKVRLSSSMVNDHYMPIYKKTLEQLILELEKELPDGDEEDEGDKGAV